MHCFPVIQNQRQIFSDLMKIYERNYLLLMQLSGGNHLAHKPILNSVERRVGNKRYRIRIQEFEKNSWTSNCSFECTLMNIKNDQIISLLFRVSLRVYLDSKQVQVYDSDISLLKFLKIDITQDDAIVKWYLNSLLNNILMALCQKMYLKLT